MMEKAFFEQKEGQEDGRKVAAYQDEGGLF